jgi:NADPH-ferrihemoprotein reductase
VQDLIWDNRKDLAPLILEKRAYIYICGDAKSMSKSVEDKLTRLLAEARGGTPEVEGAKELKLLKDRNVSAGCIPMRFAADLYASALDDRCLELGEVVKHIIVVMHRGIMRIDILLGYTRGSPLPR